MITLDVNTSEIVLFCKNHYDTGVAGDSAEQVNKLRPLIAKWLGYSTDTPVTDYSVVAVMKQVVERVGLNEKLSDHNFLLHMAGVREQPTIPFYIGKTFFPPRDDLGMNRSFLAMVHYMIGIIACVSVKKLRDGYTYLDHDKPDVWDTLIEFSLVEKPYYPLFSRINNVKE